VWHVRGDRLGAALIALAVAALPAVAGSEIGEHAAAEPVAAAGAARAGGASSSSAAQRGDPASSGSPADRRSGGELVDFLVDLLADQARSVDRALATVQDRLDSVAAGRAHRLAAALRVSRSAPGDDAAATARKLAAVRLLLARDRDERALLLDEIAGLTAARARIAAERSRAPAIALPARLAWPARGTIARRFGALAHERSHATLSRRGIDLEVAERGVVVAPAAGTVRYAGPIRGLERGVILDHGDYVTVIAKLGELALPVDAAIAAGDRIGRAAHHRVYFEVRVKLGPGGLPIDPEPLLPASVR